MTTLEIINKLCRVEVLKRNFACRNVKYFFGNCGSASFESDVLAYSKSERITEFEVKISRSDFAADKKKTRWQWLNYKIDSYLPNYFYYACPPELIKREECPKHAGLVWVSENEIKVIKKAPLLHGTTWKKERVLEKFLRVTIEREYLGCCLLTHKNKEIRQRNEEREQAKEIQATAPLFASLAPCAANGGGAKR